MGGREGKCGVRVQNNTRSVNKATQRTTMKRSFYWHVFFIKYVITVIQRAKLLIRPGWTSQIKLLNVIVDDRHSSRSSLNDTAAGLVFLIDICER